ncbi:MAG: AraC family transcriptional regulator [Blastocatellia bacterium]
MSLTLKSNGADVLTDVLNKLRIRGRVFCSTDLSAPWAMSIEPDNLAHFHVVESGGGWLKLAGAKKALPLASGDLALIPHGQGHILCGGSKTKPVPLERLLKNRPPGQQNLRHGGGGDETHMICGSFEFERGVENPLLQLLPPLIHIRGYRGRTSEWLELTLKLLANEARQARQGSEAILTRLSDVVFVQAVRAWIEEQPEDQGGWLGALRDPKIGAALALIHREPERTWSVASLSSEVGMSRSLFAARFTAKVGQAPLSYLTRWRMQLAADLLRDGQLTVREVAGRAGYESEPSFSKAFKRQFGVSPGAYRRIQSNLKA